MPDYTSLKGVSQVGQSLLSDQLEANLVGFFNWAFLGVGGFFNVTIPTSGWYGGQQHRLRPARDPNFQDGQVWEAFRKDWVWETGVEYPYQPIRVSGVYVNGAFHAPADSGWTHHVDYPLGRVIFDNPIATSSVVTCEYSYRLYQWYTADVPWWQELQRSSFRVDDPQFLQWGSGAWDLLAQSRVQLPAVVVEAVPQVSSYGFQIGSEAQVVRQEVKFHLLTEERPSLKWVHDAITHQKDKRLRGFDKNLLFSQGRFPLDDWGGPSPSGLQYPQLVQDQPSGCFWNQVRFADVRSYPQPRLGDVRYAVVQGTFELDML